MIPVVRGFLDVIVDEGAGSSDDDDDSEAVIEGATVWTVDPGEATVAVIAVVSGVSVDSTLSVVETGFSAAQEHTARAAVWTLNASGNPHALMTQPATEVEMAAMAEGAHWQPKSSEEQPTEEPAATMQSLWSYC